MAARPAPGEVLSIDRLMTDPGWRHVPRLVRTDFMARTRDAATFRSGRFVLPQVFGVGGFASISAQARATSLSLVLLPGMMA